MKTLSSLQHQVIPHSTLLALVDDYSRPNAKIHKLSQQGKLVPLKKDSTPYLITKHLQKN